MRRKYIKIKEYQYEAMDWVYVALNGDQGRALVNMVMNLRAI
jgi:hypothetical protein